MCHIDRHGSREGSMRLIYPGLYFRELYAPHIPGFIPQVVYIPDYTSLYASLVGYTGLYLPICPTTVYTGVILPICLPTTVYTGWIPPYMPPYYRIYRVYMSHMPPYYRIYRVHIPLVPPFPSPVSLLDIHEAQRASQPLRASQDRYILLF